MFFTRSPKTIGPDFDHLSTASPNFDPPFQSSLPTKRVAVVACMRNEGLVILEWVAHYRTLGFDSIIIYTNNNDDGSDQLLLALHRAGIITLVWNNCAPGVRAQFKAYRHAFWHSPEVWEHDWIAYLDADEFLIPLIEGRMVSIHAYIQHLERQFGASAVSLNWRWFAGDLSYERAQGLLFERFRDAAHHNHVKTLFRLRDAYDVDVHCPKIFAARKVIGGSGMIRELPSHHAEEPNYYLGQVNHYWQRSFQEFYIKRQRGRANQPEPRPWSTFFDWCGDAHPDPHPGREHIDRVHAEIRSLRGIRAVRRARRLVERLLKERLSASEIQEAYVAARVESANGRSADRCSCEVVATDQNFDEEAYLRANPDVAAAVAAGQQINGRAHFEAFGCKENRVLRFSVGDAIM